jgi:3D (Asp-Asp-Asp) domain-containing protein
MRQNQHFAMHRSNWSRRLVILGLVTAVAQGCAAHRAPAVQPVAPQADVMTFLATAYCQPGTTASGADARQGIVAADPGVLPLGTVIRVDTPAFRNGVYRVLDTGRKIRGQHIDLFVRDCAEAKRFGRQQVRVTVVK